MEADDGFTMLGDVPSKSLPTNRRNGYQLNHDETTEVRKDEEKEIPTRTTRRLSQEGGNESIESLAEKIVYVTGGQGILGNAIIKGLIKDGRHVRALVADPETARIHIPWNACELVRGDICDRETVERTMDGCPIVYHCEELMEQWVNDKNRFYLRNVIGTKNMVEVATALGVEKFVFTSSATIFDYQPGKTFDETAPITQTKYTEYERTKRRADAIVYQACKEGLPAVFLHPALLYGPGPILSHDGLNYFLLQLFRQTITTLPPGGAAVVYCEDAARGHILAEHLGEIGGRYILSEGYYTLEEIFQMACNVLGIKAVRPSRLPSWAALAFSVAGETWASNVTGRAPPLPQGQLRLLESAITPSSFSDRSHTESQHPARASEFLGWMPLSFGEGMQATYEFFVFSNLVNPHRS